MREACIFEKTKLLLMKILVPSDYSTIADEAFDAACKIALRQDADIHIFHAAEMPQGWDKMPLADELRSDISDTMLKNATTAYEVRSEKAAKLGLKTSFHYSEGRFLENIERLTAEINFDIVVIGSHGASGKKEWFVGSKTQKVIRHIHENVLVVKNPVQSIDFPKVLFASGLFEEDQNAFIQLLDFIKTAKVKEIHILAIETGGLFNPPKVVMLEALKDFKTLAEDYHCETHFHHALSIEAGIDNFIRNNDIDLVALSNHIKHPLKRFFTGSNVEMVVNHAEVPIFSIDY